MVHQHLQPVVLVELQVPNAGREHRDGRDVFLRDQAPCRVKEADNEPMCWLMVTRQLPVDMKHVFLFYRPAFDHRLDRRLCKQKGSKTSSAVRPCRLCAVQGQGQGEGDGGSPRQSVTMMASGPLLPSPPAPGRLSCTLTM